jgi:hydrogenase small subunit
VTTISRRDFLKIGAFLSAGMAMSYGTVGAMARGLERIASGLVRVVWIQAQSCSGCSVSLLNSDRPGIAEVITNMISLTFHGTVSAATGVVAMDVLKRVEKEGNYILVVEGSIPLGMPSACTIGGIDVDKLLTGLIQQAKAVVAVGTCAAFGGIPAAEGNPTGAVGVGEFMKAKNLAKPLINLPGCPNHYEESVGTLAYVAGKGIPKLDPILLTPNMFYSRSTLDECPRYHAYERKEFAQKFGDEHGCLFTLGCLGPLTKTRCSHRQWNGGVNWCIRASAPCIGCCSVNFSRQKAFPFYRKGEKVHTVKYSDSDRKGAGK